MTDPKDEEIARLRKENEILRHELLSGNKSLAMYWIGVGINFLEGSADERSLGGLRALMWLRSNLDGTNPFRGDINEKLIRSYVEEGIKWNMK